MGKFILYKLRILQKKAIRIITHAHYIAYTDPLFSKLKLLKLDDLYKHQLGIFMNKAANSQLPDSINRKNCYSLNINEFTVDTANKKLCIFTKCSLYLHLFSHGGEDHVFHANVIFNVVRIMYYLMYSCSHLMNKLVQTVCSYLSNFMFYITLYFTCNKLA